LRLAELDPANLPADVAAIPTTAQRGTDNAALASVCTSLRLAELDAANLPANIDTLITRITAAVALASVCTPTRLAELDAGNLPADIAAIPTTAQRGTDGVDTAPMRGTNSAALASVCTSGRLAELDAGNLPADIAALPVTPTQSEASDDVTVTSNAVQDTEGAWVELIASSGFAITELSIAIIMSFPDRHKFDLGTGAAAAEVVLIPDMLVESESNVVTVFTKKIAIASGTRISIRSTNTETGNSRTAIIGLSVEGP